MAKNFPIQARTKRKPSWFIYKRNIAKLGRERGNKNIIKKGQILNIGYDEDVSIQKSV